MKKLIAILVVFAVFAGAAFAQDGSWAIGGSGQIGARLDFVPTLQDPAENARVRGQGDLRGNLSLDYTKGTIKAGLSFNSRGAIGAYAEGSGTVAATGDKWAFRASRDLINLLAANNLSGTVTGEVSGTDIDDGVVAFDLRGAGDLWGNYTFAGVLEGLFVEAAVSRETEQWVAEKILGDAFSKTVSKDYLLLDLTAYKSTGDDASVLTIGYKLPNLFNATSGAAPGTWGDFLDGSLRKSVVGAKFSTKLGTDSALDIALQFAFNQLGEDYASGNNGLRLMAKFTIDKSMWAAVDFKGVFGYKNYTKSGTTDKVDSAALDFGAKFSFTSTDEDKVFNFDVALRFGVGSTALNADLPGSATSTFTAILNAAYKIEPKYFQAKIGLEFGFPIRGADLSKDVKDAAMTYAITPEVNFNFLGTGAGTTDTGIILAYRIAGSMGYAQDYTSNNDHNNNCFTLTFKWKF